MPIEERGLGSRSTQQVGRGRRLGNLRTPIIVQKLQTALHAKAKEEPGYRFYLLYDKIYRQDVLRHAYRSCKANKGAAGVDGVRFEDIEATGEEQWLGELAERLRKNHIGCRLCGGTTESETDGLGELLLPWTSQYRLSVYEHPRYI
jgi:hypothetical protein